MIDADWQEKGSRQYGEMQEADIGWHPETLRSKWESLGYLFFRAVLNREEVAAVQALLLDELEQQ
eukprot:COSAG05_NODE_14088_length_408_cov_1.042071_1_plen_64_part_01